MPMELAAQTDLEKPEELAVQALPEVELQTEEEVQAALSAG